MSKVLYTYDEYEYIYNHYNTDGAAAISEALERSVPSIENKANKLGLVPHGVFTTNELALAQKYGADIEIVKLGALLHDIALICKVGDRKDHHINGKILAEEILKLGTTSEVEEKLKEFKNK